MDKTSEYTIKLLSHIAEMFDNEDCDSHISTEELEEGNNATDFIHALATIVPMTFYKKFTGQNVDNLGFNHIANRLCFQYSTKLRGQFEDSEDNEEED